MTASKCITGFSGKNKMRVAGLMSGTSADGVDAAIVDIEKDSVRIVAFDTFSYPSALRNSILNLCRSKSCQVADICHLNFAIGEVFAESVIKLCRKNKLDLSSVDLIGSHGQTIYHNPQGLRFGKHLVRSTLQIGEPSVIAQRTSITTVADFRPRDMAANGQGAPLVPFADYVLFRHKRRSRVIQNIGGIANLTYLPANCGLSDIVAFDTGPGNMIIDRLASIISRGKQNFDLNGKIASTGKINQRLLDNMLRHWFFSHRPPKSTGREEFGHQYCDALYSKAIKKAIPAEDIIATATALTAVSISQAYRRFLPQMPDEVILCGGGAHNGTLVKMLLNELGQAKIMFSDEFGISCDAKEAVSFAILAHATIKGVANNVPSATGADQSLILGKIIPA
jgi:anhydro-N-acetylmuramic acid kinase